MGTKTDVLGDNRQVCNSHIKITGQTLGSAQEITTMYREYSLMT
jgi:hypothetical protein